MYFASCELLKLFLFQEYGSICRTRSTFMVLDRLHPVIKDPYTDSSQPISNTTHHKNNMFHKPQNPQTAKPENRFYFILFYFILFYFILFYFILFYFILFCFILFIFGVPWTIYCRMRTLLSVKGIDNFETEHTTCQFLVRGVAPLNLSVHFSQSSNFAS